MMDIFNWFGSLLGVPAVVPLRDRQELRRGHYSVLP